MMEGKEYVSAVRWFVGWNLTSLFSTNMAISEMTVQYVKVASSTYRYIKQERDVYMPVI